MIDTTDIYHVQNIIETLKQYARIYFVKSFIAADFDKNIITNIFENISSTLLLYVKIL